MRRGSLAHDLHVDSRTRGSVADGNPSPIWFCTNSWYAKSSYERALYKAHTDFHGPSTSQMYHGRSSASRWSRRAQLQLQYSGYPLLTTEGRPSHTIAWRWPTLLPLRFAWLSKPSDVIDFALNDKRKQSEVVFKELCRGTNQMQFTATDLKPRSEYKFRSVPLRYCIVSPNAHGMASLLRVLSANSLGESEWSDILTVQTEKSTG